MPIRKFIGLGLMLTGFTVALIGIGLYRLANWELVDGTICSMAGIGLLIIGVVVSAKETLPRISDNK